MTGVGAADCSDDAAVGAAWAALESLADPEIPVVSLRELGILRGVQRAADGVLEVVITPTYSGCPALMQIEDDVRATLLAKGLDARVVTRLAPAWTTDWIDDAAKDKLRAWGIAPPQQRCAGPRPAGTSALRFVRDAATPAVPCPRCGSSRTVQTSAFGSTACKALYRCEDCREPFDYFKPY